MIFGIGTDIVSIARIEAVRLRHGPRFAQRILTSYELEEYAKTDSPGRFLAKRFAAKEAFAKAFGTGLIAPVTLQAISIMHEESGKPYFGLNATLSLQCMSQGIKTHLSISDEKEFVVAFAVMEQNP